MTNINFFSIMKQSCHLIPIEIKPKKFLRIMQGLRSLWFPLLVTLALLCDNKRPSAVCQQKFRTALTLNYTLGLNSFNHFLSLQYTLAEATALLTEIERQEKSQAVNQSTPKKNSASTSTEPNFADFPEEDWDKEVAGDA